MYQYKNILPWRSLLCQCIHVSVTDGTALVFEVSDSQSQVQLARYTRSCRLTNFGDLTYFGHSSKRIHPNTDTVEKQRKKNNCVDGGFVSARTDQNSQCTAHPFDRSVLVFRTKGAKRREKRNTPQGAVNWHLRRRNGIFPPTRLFIFNYGINWIVGFQWESV